MSVFGGFLVFFSRIRTKYGDSQSKSPNSFRVRENMDQKITECGHILRIAYELYICINRGAIDGSEEIGERKKTAEHR